jgi:hypothetical protein
MTTPERVTELLPNEIFVFGSNYAGRHGKGAAKDALKFGARTGVGMGFCGQTYAIATKDRNLQTLPLDRIRVQVERFLESASASDNRNLRFLVTPIGCGLAGYKPVEIAPMFIGSPGNVILPLCFIPFVHG